MTHVTCRLTAKNRDQLRNPMLGNRVWATFTIFFRDLAQKSASLETGVFVQCYTLILVHATAGLDYLPAPNFWSIPWHQTEHQSISPTDLLPSVLWSCWLGGRKGIRPVKKIRVVGHWHGYLSGARCRLAYGPADATATHCLLLQ